MLFRSLRSRRPHAILKVRNELIWAIRNYFYKNKFVLIDTPLLTGAVGETTSTLFETQYLNEGKAYLAQTGQLYLEAAIAAFGKVYCFGPTFRAEKSKTRRHLTEFWMVEAEEAFYDNDDNMDLQEDFLVFIVNWILEKCQEELKDQAFELGRVTLRASSSQSIVQAPSSLKNLVTVLLPVPKIGRAHV